MGEIGVVGINSATGGLATSQQVCNCTYECAAPCPAAVPPPLTLCKPWRLSPPVSQSVVPFWKSGFPPLKLVVWEGFVCSDLVLEEEWRLLGSHCMQKARNLQGRQPCPRGANDLWSEEPTGDRQDLEFEAITLQPEEAWGLQEVLEALVSIVISYPVGP